MNKIQKLIGSWALCFGAFKKEKKKNLELYGALLKEEADETIGAIIEGNRKEIVDGALDVIWIATMILNIEGVDLEKGIQVVYDSNMSKLSDKKVQTNLLTSVPVEVEGQTKWVIKRVEDGKIMKPSSFVEPDIDSLL